MSDTCTAAIVAFLVAFLVRVRGRTGPMTVGVPEADET